MMKTNMMKMAAVCEIFLLLLCWSITSAGSSNCDINAATGTNITVPLNQQIPENYKLRWKHDDKVILDRRGAKFSVGVSGDIHQDGSLKLTKVQKDKSGLYTPEAFSLSGQFVKDLKKTLLCILDPVPKPKVTQKCSQSKAEVEFTCTVTKTDPGVTFKWFMGDKEVEKQTARTLKQKTKDVETIPIKCRVANKASNQTSDSVTQTCVTPGFVFPEEVLGVSVWIFVAGGAGIVLVLILITIICCVRTRRRKTMRVKDEEELRLGWTNPQQQQHQHQHQHQHEHQQNLHPDHPHRHHHHHQQQQPAGHTGPRQQRSKQPRPRAPEPTNGQPQPSPRRAQPPKPPNDDDEQPPPLPQPRKKGPKTPRM